MVDLAPGGEAARSLGVGLAGVRVPDMGDEELDDAPGGGGVGRQQGREPCGAAPLHRQCGGGAAGGLGFLRWFSAHLI